MLQSDKNKRKILKAVKACIDENGGKARNGVIKEYVAIEKKLVSERVLNNYLNDWANEGTLKKIEKNKAHVEYATKTWNETEAAWLERLGKTREMIDSVFAQVEENKEIMSPNLRLRFMSLLFYVVTNFGIATRFLQSTKEGENSDVIGTDAWTAYEEYMNRFDGLLNSDKSKNEICTEIILNTNKLHQGNYYWYVTELAPDLFLDQFRNKKIDQKKYEEGMENISKIMREMGWAHVDGNNEPTNTKGTMPKGWEN